MIRHAKVENGAFLFPINDPVSFMNSSCWEREKQKTKLNSVDCSQLSVSQKFKQLH